jgi:hypothetical protein
VAAKQAKASVAQIKRADIVSRSFSGIFPRYAKRLPTVPLKEEVYGIPKAFAVETNETYHFWGFSAVIEG